MSNARTTSSSGPIKCGRTNVRADVTGRVRAWWRSRVQRVGSDQRHLCASRGHGNGPGAATAAPGPASHPHDAGGRRSVGYGVQGVLTTQLTSSDHAPVASNVLEPPLLAM